MVADSMASQIAAMRVSTTEPSSPTSSRRLHRLSRSILTRKSDSKVGRQSSDQDFVKLTRCSCAVVVINEADLLSRDAQSALRRTMEKFTANLRVILCANSTSKIIGPIRSRCLLLRVGAPSEDEVSRRAYLPGVELIRSLQICKVLNHVSKKESLALPPHVASLLAQTSAGNLRRALLSLEALAVQDPGFKTIPPPSASGSSAQSKGLDLVPRPDWEKYASKTVERILSDQSPERLLEVRGMLYELLVHCIPASLIMIVSSWTRQYFPNNADEMD